MSVMSGISVYWCCDNYNCSQQAAGQNDWRRNARIGLQIGAFEIKNHRGSFSNDATYANTGVFVLKFYLFLEERAHGARVALLIG